MADLGKIIENVKKYDSAADEKLVTAIFDSLKLVHENLDAMLVGCTDDSEKATVKKNFLMKKLGLDDSPELDAAVDEICAQMKEDRQKQRVTFYYLLAKKFGKESVYA